MKNITFIKQFVISVVLFVVLIGGGVWAWQYLGPWREAKVEQYQQNAKQLVASGKGMGLWELEKAYFVGLDYKEYRKKRAAYLMELGNSQGQGELAYVVKKKWFSDDVNFWYGNQLFADKQYVEAEKYLLDVDRKNINTLNQLVLLNDLAYLSGLKGDWSGANQYIEMALLNNKNDQQIIDMAVFLQLVDGNMDEALDLIKNNKQYLDLQKKIEVLFAKNGDLLILGTADLGIDLGLADWSRKMIDSVEFHSQSQKFVSLVYGRSLVASGKCSEAMKYFLQAKEVDTVDAQVDELISRAYKCQNV
jgi:tetratricopeptide (TPR) repeat protein